MHYACYLVVSAIYMHCTLQCTLQCVISVVCIQSVTMLHETVIHKKIVIDLANLHAQFKIALEFCPEIRNFALVFLD